MLSESKQMNSICGMHAIRIQSSILYLEFSAQRIIL